MYHYTTSTWLEHLAVYNNYLYIACDTVGLMTLNVSDPSKPAFVSTCKMDRANTVIVSNNNIFVGSDEDSLRVLNTVAPYSRLYSGEKQMAQSNNIFTDKYITNAMIKSVSSCNNESGILLFELTNDGETWFILSEDYRLEFPTNASGTLRWRAKLLTYDQTVSPVIDELKIYYWTD